MKTGLVYDPIYLEHETGAHPERPERISMAMEHLSETGLLDEVVRVEPRAAERDDLTMIHRPEMVDAVFFVCDSGGGYMDMDTPVSAGSCKAALKAVGGLFEAADRMMEGEIDNALCLVRPPGHHATPNRSMGFCLFNNAALCARYVQKRWGLERVLIVDWDVHHGNGTQDAFYSDPSVMYFSMHRSPFYPGTGSRQEAGESDAKGFTINVPLPGGTTNEEYLERFREVMEGPAAEFAPEFIIVSAGFDAYKLDPLAAFCLDASDYHTLTRGIMDLAAKTASNRVLSTLEGGYNIGDQPLLIAAHLRALLGLPR